MLLLPLHRPLNRATFPFITALLVVINVAVFFLLQSTDARRLAELDEWYGQSGLAQQEWPEYLRYLESNGEPAERARIEQLDEDQRPSALVFARLMDARWDNWLKQAASGSAAGDASPADRELLEAEYQRRTSRITTYRYFIRYSEIDPVRLLSHAFLHGGVMHLLGNMFFLVALGLLVEGALGEWRFAVLYLLGIVGSALFSQAINWGAASGGLGASGAIAALMGAFCVVWGRRPVRFFWWFFVPFGYIRKPAIWLLPAWLAWEAWNMLFNADAGIGFDAHLGGLLTGALVGWAFTTTGGLRYEFMDAEDAQDSLTGELAEIRGLLGNMQLADAGARLLDLDEQYPDRLEIVALQHRAAALRGVRAEIRQHALRALQLAAKNVDEVNVQEAIMNETFPPDIHLPRGPWQEGLRQRWMALECYGQVLELLERGSFGNGAARHWFELALRLREHGNEAGFRDVLDILQQRFPAAEEAGKARFWLAQSP